MRTTLRLNNRLLREAKQLAARSGRTLTDVVEEALRDLLARRRQERSSRAPVRLTTVKGRGALKGVDLDDTASLVDRMEGARGS